MGLMKLNHLYKTLVLEHANHPHHNGALVDYDDEELLRNPSCGDTIRVQIKYRNDQIEAIQFTSVGCTISKASCSMMTDALTGCTVSEAIKMINAFSGNIISNDDPHHDATQLGDAMVLSSVAKFPTRVRCATLGWHAAENILLKRAKEMSAND